jgi:hypothetical protein
MNNNHFYKIVLALFLINCNVFGQSVSWHRTAGPMQPEVNCIEVGYDNRVFVGTHDGWVYQSTDDGASWTSLGCFAHEAPVAAIRLTEWGDIYIGAYKAFYRSSDNGSSWILIDTNYVTSILSDAPNYLYVVNYSDLNYIYPFYGHGNRVLITTDNCSTWHDPEYNRWSTNEEIKFLKHDVNGNILYSNYYIIYSKDHGNTWSYPVNPGYIYHDLCSIDSQKLAVASSSGLCLFKDTVLIPDKPSEYHYNKTLLDDIYFGSVYKDEAGMIYAGTYYSGYSETGLYKSTDLGETWNRIAFVREGVKITGNKRGWLFASADDRFYRSNDGGHTWQYVRIHDMRTRGKVYAIARNSQGDLFTTASGCIFRSTDHGDSWNTLNKWVPYSDGVLSLVVNSKDDLFAGRSMYIAQISPPYSYCDTLPYTMYTFYPAITMAKGPNGDLFVGSDRYGFNGFGVKRSTDDGLTWQSLGLKNQIIRSFAFNSQGNIFALGDSAYRYYENEGMWHPVGQTERKNWTAILLDKYDSLFLASNGQGTYMIDPPNYLKWHHLNFNPLTILYYALATDRDGNVFAGTDIGVLKLNRDTGMWMRYGLDSIMITTLYADPDGYLYAGTDDHGIYKTEDKTTSVPGFTTDQPIPNSHTLLQNYPNPCNPTTTIRYGVNEYGKVRIAIYSLLGQEVASLVNEEKSPGWYSVCWDATGLPSGVYIYRLETPGTNLPNPSVSNTKKLIVLK